MSRPKSGHRTVTDEDVVPQIPVSRNENIQPSLVAEISRRAYELYEERGKEDGHAEEDWLRAEEEILEGVPGNTNPHESEEKQ